MGFRIGTGYDVHALVADRPLIIGGITIPHRLGLLGHSDADVLAHAITDALLGALALGSIGDWFPDTDASYKDADSLELLKTVVQDIKKRGYQLVNVDSVIMAQEPKFKSYIQAIRESLATAMGCDVDQVGVKATTTESLGFEGREEGIAAQATVLIESVPLAG
jgi:2-C-methyl-D-erythritol 2,4-cyclodiphosphate synthase